MIYDQELFPNITPAPPEEYLPLALAIGTEKARSELLIMPVLAEVRRQLQAQISLFSGLGQCVAEMVAAKLFNERANKPLSPIFGAVTTGELWRFAKLEGTELTVDRDNENLNPLERLLGILTAIA